ncbi:MAG: endonuclease/exonuclease/phosphatase family protein, partial [Hyphomicrobium sp.]
MRIATFNLENLDLPPKAQIPLEIRAEVLRPALKRLQADVLCLQEVNGQHVKGHKERVLAALDALLKGTPYEDYHRATTSASSGHGVADVHNLVTLSKYPLHSHREVRNSLIPPLQYIPQTAEPVFGENLNLPLRFERPLLITEHDLGKNQILTIVNLHLRAPLAHQISGQKIGPFVWKNISGWAEGFFMSSVQRSGQALELRMLLDQMLKSDPQKMVALAGDFNAQDHETPLKIVVGAEEDTGNGLLSSGSFVVLDRAISEDRRWS